MNKKNKKLWKNFKKNGIKFHILTGKKITGRDVYDTVEKNISLIENAKEINSIEDIRKLIEKKDDEK